MPRLWGIRLSTSTQIGSAVHGNRWGVQPRASQETHPETAKGNAIGASAHPLRRASPMETPVLLRRPMPVTRNGARRAGRTTYPSSTRPSVSQPDAEAESEQAQTRRSRATNRPGNQDRHRMWKRLGRWAGQARPRPRCHRRPRARRDLSVPAARVEATGKTTTPGETTWTPSDSGTGFAVAWRLPARVPGAAPRPGAGGSGRRSGPRPRWASRLHRPSGPRIRTVRVRR